MNYCRKCGNALKEGQQFCSKCGTEYQSFTENGEISAKKVLKDAYNAPTDNMQIDLQYEAARSKNGTKGKSAKQQKGKSVKTKVILILTAFVIVGIAVSALVLWLSISKKSGTKIIKELEAGNTYKTQTIAEALQKAEDYASAGDYDNALGTLSTALESYPGDSELTAAQSEYKAEKESAEVAKAVAEADAYVSDKNYDAALAIIESAMLSYPSNSTLSAKYSEIEGKKPTALTDFAFVNYICAEIVEDVVYDTIGNVYWGNTVKLRVLNYGGYRAYLAIYLGKEYKTLTGIIACGTSTSESGAGTLYIKDNTEQSVLAYYAVARTMVPTEVTVDVSDVEWLTIEIDRSSGSDLYALLSDFQLEK